MNCYGNGISNDYQPIANKLRAAGRIAMVTETGGGSTSGCFTYVNDGLKFFVNNADVYFGWTVWGAGNLPRYGTGDGQVRLTSVGPRTPFVL